MKPITERALEEAAQELRAQAFLAWRALPETQRFFHFLTTKREQLKEELANGTYVLETPEKTATMYAKALGRAEVLGDLIELTAEDLES